MEVNNDAIITNNMIRVGWSTHKGATSELEAEPKRLKFGRSERDGKNDGESSESSIPSWDFKERRETAVAAVEENEVEEELVHVSLGISHAIPDIPSLDPENEHHLATCVNVNTSKTLEDTWNAYSEHHAQTPKYESPFSKDTLRRLRTDISPTDENQQFQSFSYTETIYDDYWMDGSKAITDSTGFDHDVETSTQLDPNLKMSSNLCDSLRLNVLGFDETETEDNMNCEDGVAIFLLEDHDGLAPNPGMHREFSGEFDAERYPHVNSHRFLHHENSQSLPSLTEEEEDADVFQNGSKAKQIEENQRFEAKARLEHGISGIDREYPYIKAQYRTSKTSNLAFLLSDDSLAVAVTSPPLSSYSRKNPIDRGMRLITSGSSVEEKYPEREKIEALIRKELNDKYIRESREKRVHGSIVHHSDYAYLGENSFQILYYSRSSSLEKGKELDEQEEVEHQLAEREMDSNKYDLEIPTSLKSAREVTGRIIESKKYDLGTRVSPLADEHYSEASYSEYLNAMDGILPTSSPTPRNHFYTLPNKEEWIRSLDSAFNMDDDVSHELKWNVHHLDTISSVLHVTSDIDLATSQRGEEDKGVTNKDIHLHQKTFLSGTLMSAVSFISYEKVADLFHKFSLKSQGPSNTIHKRKKIDKSEPIGPQVSVEPPLRDEPVESEKFTGYEFDTDAIEPKMGLNVEEDVEHDVSLNFTHGDLGIAKGKAEKVSQPIKAIRDDISDNYAREKIESEKTREEKSSDVKDSNSNQSSGLPLSLIEVSPPGKIVSMSLKETGVISTSKTLTGPVSQFQGDNEDKSTKEITEAEESESTDEVIDAWEAAICTSENETFDIQDSPRNLKEDSDDWKLNNKFVNSEEKPQRKQKTLRKMILCAISKDSNSNEKSVYGAGKYAEPSKIGWTRYLLRGPTKGRVHSYFSVDSGESLKGFAAEYANKNELRAPKSSDALGKDVEDARRMMHSRSNVSDGESFIRRPLSSGPNPPLELFTGHQEPTKGFLRSLKEYIAAPSPVGADLESSRSSIPMKESILGFPRRIETLDTGFGTSERTTRIRFAASPDFMTSQRKSFSLRSRLGKKKTHIHLKP